MDGQAVILRNRSTSIEAANFSNSAPGAYPEIEVPTDPNRAIEGGMSHPIRSLNAFVDSRELLAQFDLAIATAAQPSTAACPLCGHGTLQIFVDHSAGGH
jgi:hypothetical protein